LSLWEIMIAIAILAFAYAFLFPILAATLTVTLTGILVLKGLRLPIITERPGVWRWLPWLAWLLMLVACPAAILVLDEQYHYPGGIQFAFVPPMDPDRAWALRMLEPISNVHLGLSVVAAVSVVVLARGYRSWLAWAGTLLVGLVTIVLCFRAYDNIYGWSR
jgi:hypothetical protein